MNTPPNEPFCTWTWPLTGAFLQHRRSVLERVVTTLQERDQWYKKETPLTRWKTHRTYTVDFEEYEKWTSYWERHPKTGLGPTAEDPHPGPTAAGLAAPEISRARQRVQDSVRLVLTVASLAGWASFASAEGLQIVVDINDNVQRDSFNGPPRPTRRLLTEDERCAIKQIASRLGHVGSNDILTIATNFHLSLAHVRDHHIPLGEAQQWLRQREPVSLATADEVTAQLQQRVRALWKEVGRGRRRI